MTATRSTKILPIALALAAAPLLGGCNGALIGNLVVLAVTVGIFFGTLGLGRAGNAARSAASSTADRSSAQQPRS
ncbi:hypothetical protein [Sandaracinus amylolyticus]|uniref:hypothetical protein n=1 Tax=Sandaracinus amylolyticus TaxID=927083 RepID=UPI001F344878|nr:hypothetical protein [Sandaracinus amylolyticus]UJR84228.1 Hypothetical protein I5071_63000 [Sandaracinus amylolyticus]